MAPFLPRRLGVTISFFMLSLNKGEKSMKVIRTNQRYLVLVGWLKMKTVTLAGTALFSALVVVFDYTLKFMA